MALSQSQIDAKSLPILKLFFDDNYARSTYRPYANFSEWIAWVDKEWPNFRKLFAEAVVIAEDPSEDVPFTMARWQTLMRKLAAQTNGRWPDRKGLQAFLNAPYEEVVSFSYQAELVASGAGKAVDTLLNLNKSFLMAGAAVALFWLYQNMNRFTKKSAKQNPSRKRRKRKK